MARAGKPTVLNEDLRFLKADLHLHSVLSACASREMLPSMVVARAQELGVQLLALTDHNSVENVAAFQEAAQGTGITILPGMEVQTREEVHMVCFFDSLQVAVDWQGYVYAHLPGMENNERFFGPQWLVNSADEIIGNHSKLFQVSTSLSVEQVVAEVQRRGGLSIPAHVDRPAYSIISNLGFVPPNLGVVAVEISSRFKPAQAREQFPCLAGLGLVADSDAHYLADMQGRNTFKVKAPTTRELALALISSEGREMWIDGETALNKIAQR